MTVRDRSGGFILVAVLAVMALIAGLVAAVSLLVRSSVATVNVEVTDLLGDSLVMAGIEIAAYTALVNQEPPDAVDGLVVRLDDGTVTLFDKPTGGRIDLNTSPPELLAAAWRATGSKRMRPAAFAQRVIDWRDADQDEQPVGAEADAYSEAGVPYRPADEPFRNVEELRFVLGVTAADIDKLRPLVTVLNPKGTVNLFDAPREVLDALPGFRGAATDRILKTRVKRTDETSQRLLKEVPAGANELVNADVMPDRVRRVRIEARPNRGASQTVEVVIVPDPTGRRPYLVSDWRLAGADMDTAAR